jgi:hypothetical protein
MVAIGVGVAAGTAGAAQPPPSDINRASLVGRVTDACTGAPIGGATVGIASARPPSAPTLDAVSLVPVVVSTNGGGHFLVEGLAPGTYVWSAIAAGEGQPPPDDRQVLVGFTDAVSHLDIVLTPVGGCG